MSQFKINLPDDVAIELSAAGAELQLTPEAVAEDMIRRMIALRRIDRLRKEIQDKADPNQFSSEDEILEQIS